MKKKMNVTLAAAAVLAMAGIAQAAPAELNIYGASAQYTYWNAQSKNFAINALGCPSANVTDPVNNGGKHGFVSATNCTSALVPVNTATGKRDIDIRYSGIASAEGPLSVSKQNPLDAALATGCDKTKGERLMYASSSSLICKPVHVGTSDVAGESLVQGSDGQKFGPLGGGAFSATLTGVDTSTLDSANTVVVPFGFFVNSSVKARKCTAGYVGAYCTADSQCNNGVTAGVCGTTSETIDNISREEATVIFSGLVYNWKELGDYFDDKPVVACLRHAGSGTHSAFDLTVMNSGWGNNVATAEEADHVYFNQGSTDEIKCVNGATSATPTGSTTVGAIGYADADQSVNVANVSQNVKQLKYNGHYPTRAAIRNGLYDFYSNAWMYTNKSADATTKGLANALIGFAQQAANVPSSKANYWAAVGEMKFNRASETNYPQMAFPTDVVLP